MNVILRGLIAITITTILPICSRATSTYLHFLGVTVQLADSTTGANFLAKEDAYLSNMSTFDYSGRFKDKEEHTVDDYLKYAAQQTRTWTKEERAIIKNGLEEIETYINENKIKLHLPDTILFIQSTCKEEFEATGYTRRNGIVLKDGESLEVDLIAHELFHVLSRNNPKLRDKLYANIGFKKCNPIDITKVMGGLNITNPDCPVVNHYIRIDTEDLVLLLHSKKPYEGGSIFTDDYIAISLMVVKGRDNEKKPVMRNGKPILYSFEDKLEIMEHIGTNTDYVIHPEEICAEHFAALVTERYVPQQVFLERMKKTLK